MTGKTPLTDRKSLIGEFLADTAWHGAEYQPLDQDASFRRYWRLNTNGNPAILMDAPPPEKPVSIFAGVARFLRRNGLYAPKIYKYSDKNGLMLLEDFGDATFTRVLADDPDSENHLYDLAIDTLIDLHMIDPIDDLSLRHYDLPVLLEEARLFIEWFFPAITGRAASTEQLSSFDQAWSQAINSLPDHKSVVVLRDFHVDNLMRLPQNTGPDCCGLLDFQDALTGSPAYDLISLIEDARRDISGELKARCMDRYFSAMKECGNFPSEAILSPCINVFAAQRHAKVLGIFVRLYKRDGKAAYLDHLPRVLALFNSALEREPMLKSVTQWMTNHLPDPDLSRL